MSLVSFKPKNHPEQVQVRGACETTDDRRTPASLFAPLHAEHGFTLDVAASSENAKCARYFDLEADGLAQSWTGEVVWCNPPYSGLASWVRKALYEVERGCHKVVMLLPANRPEQAWWQDLIEPIRDRGRGVTTRYLPGRTRFEGPNGPMRPKKSTSPRSHGGGVRPPFGCVVVVFTPPATPLHGTTEKGATQK